MHLHVHLFLCQVLFALLLIILLTITLFKSLQELVTNHQNTHSNKNTPKPSPKMTQKIMLNFKLILLGDSNTGKTAIVNQYIYHTFTHTKATTGIDFFTKMFQIDDFIVKLNIFDTAGQQRYLAMTKSYFRGTNAVLFTYSLIEKHSFLNLPLWIKKFQDEAGTDAVKIVVGTKKDLVVGAKKDLVVGSKKDLKQENSLKSQRKNSFPQRLNKDDIKGQSAVKNQAQKQQRQMSKKEQQINSQGAQDPTIRQEQMENMLKTHGVAFSFETSALLNQNIDQVFQQICKYLILKEMNKTSNQDKQLNRSRVQTQFQNSKRKSTQLQDKPLSLQQRYHEQNQTKSSCC